MKKETIVTAAIFLAVGFLAGYITDAQINWNGRQKVAPTASMPAQMPPGGMQNPSGGAMNPQGLPEGHPSIDSAAIIKELEARVAQNPKDVETKLKLADYLYDQKQYPNAIEWYQRVLELDPKNVNARTDLGTAYFYSGRPQDALREYDKALAVDPRHEPTMLNAIVVNLEGLRDTGAAQKAWDRLNRQNPNHPALAGLKDKIEAARKSGS